MSSAQVVVGAATGERFTGKVIRKFSDGHHSIGKTPQPPVGAKKCRKWAVLTTIFSPSEAVSKQTKLTDWCLVIVADHKTPKDFMQLIPKMESERIVYLTVQHQEDIDSQFVQNLPWDNFGRKNIGYLYAIQHGADVLWDFDDDNILKHTGAAVSANPPPHLNSEIEYGVGADSVDVLTPDNCSYRTFNPYPILGAPTSPSWPRGIPLQDIKVARAFICSLKKQNVKKLSIGVLQSLADVQPDVDAIYRFTMKVPFSFRHSTETRPLLIPKGTLTPYNAQATLHFQRAFWALFLPVTVQGRVSDIWRSYIAQRLFWDCGLSVGFSSRPLVVQDRNPHDLIKDLSAEDDLYKRGEQLVDFLSSWKSDADSLMNRIQELYIALYERDYIQKKDVHLIQMWLSNLASIGYKFPQLVT
jgi:hypothetical protein